MWTPCCGTAVPWESTTYTVTCDPVEIENPVLWCSSHGRTPCWLRAGSPTMYDVVAGTWYVVVVWIVAIVVDHELNRIPEKRTYLVVILGLFTRGEWPQFLSYHYRPVGMLGNQPAKRLRSKCNNTLRCPQNNQGLICCEQPWENLMMIDNG